MSVQPTARTLAPDLGRNGSIDLLRFGGAIGIVWFHLHLPGYEIALAALPMFVALFVCFGLNRNIAHLNRRLLYPWLIWSAIFGAAKVAQALVHGTAISDEFALWMILAGPAIHLWFLPFSYLFVLLARRVRPEGLLPMGIALVPIAFWLANTAQLPQPFAQWVSVIPAAFMGVLLHFIRQNPSMVVTVGWISVALAAVLAMTGWDSVALQYAIGIGAVLLAFACPIRATRTSRIMAEVSFGVYLLHPLVFALALSLNVMEGLSHSVISQFAIAFVVSLAGTLLLRRSLPGLVFGAGRRLAQKDTSRPLNRAVQHY